MEPVKMPILTEDIIFDEVGFVGWIAKMRVNPRAGEYDRFISSLEFDEKTENELWPELDLVVVDWNFGNEDGSEIKRPIKRNELPPQVRNYLVRTYLKKFADSLLPKELENNSANTSTTEEKDQKIEKQSDLLLSTPL